MYSEITGPFTPVQRIALLLTLLGAALAGAAPAVAAPTFAIPGFTEQTLVSNLTQPTVVAWTPDRRILIAEKAGLLKVARPGSTSAKTVLDISDHVNDNGERGLLGMAVDSDFAHNHYLYLLYTYDPAPGGDSSGQMASRLTRVTLDNANHVSGETVLLGKNATAPCPAPANDADCMPTDALSHSVGTVLSDSHGTLWVSTGDGADYRTGPDPAAFRAYDEQSLDGKILHVDRNGKGLPTHPFCPSDANLDHVCTKAWAKGFRQPFRMAFAPNGDLLVGEVGWFTKEEIDRVPTSGIPVARNYGWPCYEGTVHTPQYEDLTAPGPTCDAEYAKEGTPAADLGPLYDYDHAGGTASVIGGPAYTGAEYPASYRNTIFFGDFTGGFMKRLVLNGSGGVGSVQDFATNWTGVALTEGPCGEVVYADLADFGQGNGSVKRVLYAPGNQAPRAAASATPPHGVRPLDVTFDASRSSDPNCDALSYKWSFGDGSAAAAGAVVSHGYKAEGTYTATVTVNDGRGKAGSARARVDVTALPKADAGPAISFDRRHGLNPRKGTLRGRATDADGMGKVYVGLGRGTRKRGKCRWWFTSVRRLSRGLHRCKRPHWIRARLVKGKWKASLRRRRIPAGSYRVVFKALDKKGNESRKLKDGRSLVRVRVHRRR